jgi:glycosyltransferase involved in cell wall biosynthesis
MGANDNDKICLVPARLSPVKGIVPFICALNASWLRGWRIIIIGQGELREEIQRIALNKGVGDKLMLMDYVPYEEMPLFYAAADLFLLPSLYDPNPLSVPEALHSGLPVALSDQAGNVEEGVEDGVNGWRLPVNDRLAFARVLESVFDSNIFELRKKGGASLKCNSQFWSTDTSIERFLSDIGI